MSCTINCTADEFKRFIGELILIKDKLTLSEGARSLLQTLDVVCAICEDPVEKGMIHSHASSSSIAIVWQGNGWLYRGCIDAVPLNTEPNAWYLTRALVQPLAARRHGIGRQMMNRLKEEVTKLGGTKIIVEPSGYDMLHTEQMAFYAKQGFVQTEPCLWSWTLAGLANNSQTL